MTTATDERTVTMTVKKISQGTNSKGEVDFELGVSASFFQSKFPTIIFVPEDVGSRIKAGDEVTFLLRAVLKEGQKGDKPFHYNWRFVSRANGAAPAAEPAPVPLSPIERRVRDLALARDPTRDSIERQTSLIQACLLAANGVLVPEEGKSLGDAIERASDRFIAWLQGTTAPDTETKRDEAPTNVDDLPFDTDTEPQR